MNSKVKVGEIKRIHYDYHKLTLADLAMTFKTSLKNGINLEMAKRVLAQNGPNIIKIKGPSWILKIFKYFFSGFCGLLWIAAIICILAWKPIGNPPDPTNSGLGILLIVVILLQAAFTAFQDWSSNKVMNSIKNMMPHSATVIREGQEGRIPIENLVVGDLVQLSYGSKVPADVRIIESHDLKFDKSMLTGESEPVEACIDSTEEEYVEAKNIAYMTTLVTNGEGKGIVVATGDKTMMGSIASLTNQSARKKTSLQKELNRFIIIIGSIAIITAFTVILLWALWLRTTYPDYINVPALLVNTISVLVAFIPEGLPVCVTLSLLIIAKRMAKSRVLVKNLSVIETLSSMNVIASDKTGTLTQNKMFVSNASVGLEEIDLKKITAKNYDLLKQLLGVCSLCNNAKFDHPIDKSVPVRQRVADGDATDIAMLKFSAEFLEIDNFKEQYTIVSDIPFNSRNKWMMKIAKPNNSDINESVFGSEKFDSMMMLKGAPDILLKKCKFILDKNGHQAPLDANTNELLITLQNRWCMLGQRVLILCRKMLKNTPVFLSQHEGEVFVQNTNDMCVVGIVGIIDPPREGISDVISKCRSAGIRVLMVTGDYPLTAAAIAKQIGIFSLPHYDTLESMRLKKDSLMEKSNKIVSEALLLTGNDIDKLTKDDWRVVTTYEEIVLARTTPEQKLRTVKEFQNDNYVVGVTGDGVNDAPALKSADIGIAMGSGSEVAMEASELVLLDNNFASILIAIENGRLVFNNLRKVILYLLPGGCMAELTSVLVSITLGVTQNLSSFEMLIISLFTDVVPSLSLIMEKPESDLLKQPPRSKNEHLVNWKFLLQAYLFLGVFIGFFSQLLNFVYLQWYAQWTPGNILLSFGSMSNGFNNLTSTQVNEFVYKGQTVTFISIVFLQIFGNLLCTRTNIKSLFDHAPWKKSSQNLYIFLAQFVSIFIVIVIVFVPFFNDIFNTRAVPVQFFIFPIIISAFIIGIDELRKYCVRNRVLFFHKTAW